jgi:hypothetical protein
MIHKAITLKFVVPEMLAVALGIVILIGIFYFTHKYPVPPARADTNHSVVSGRGSSELLNLGLSRVRLLVSRMK